MKKTVPILSVFLVLSLFISSTVSAEEIKQYSGTKLFSNNSVYAKPLYVLYMPDKNLHTYTSSSEEKKDLENTGWIDKGILCYISPVHIPVYMPLYRYCYKNTVTALDTTNNLFRSGFIKEGVLGYVPSRQDEPYTVT